MNVIQELKREQDAIEAEIVALDERFNSAIRHRNSAVLPSLRRRRLVLKKRNERLLARVRAVKHTLQQQQQ